MHLMSPSHAKSLAHRSHIGLAATLLGTIGCTVAMAAPMITRQPQSAVVTAGQPALYTVAATDLSPLSYQWWRGAEPIIGATAESYTIAAPSLADSGAIFRVTVASEAGLVESLPVCLTVNPATTPTYDSWARAIQDPAQREALDCPEDDGVPNLMKYVLGLAPTVRATADRLPWLRVDGETRWYRYTLSKTATGVLVTPQTSAGLDIWAIADGAVKIADANGTETWEVPLGTGMRVFARLAVEKQPAATAPVLSGPQGISVGAGASAQFAVTATGTGPFTYQWRRDGRDIRGATDAGYTRPVVISADDGARFSVVVRGPGGVSCSGEAVLAVTPASAGTVLYTRDRLQSPINDELAARLTAIAPAGTSLRGNVFMKIGDSITAGDGLLGDFGTGIIDGNGHSWETNILFGSRPDLKSLVQFFRTGLIPASGSEGCLERSSLAAKVGEAAGWATAGAPSALQQEYTVAQPRYAVIMYGSNDIGWYQGGEYGHVFQLTSYQTGMLRIVDDCLARGVIPILTTMPLHESYLPYVPCFAEMVRSIAQGRRVPLIDFNRAMAASGPEFNFGLGSDGVHPRPEAYNTAAWLDAESLHHGTNLRNLLTLDALARMKTLVVDGAAAPDAIVSRLPGSGTPATPFLIPGVPFADFRDTHDAPSSALDGYAGSSVPVPGPEYVYRLVVQSRSILRILAIDKGAAAVRLHLLGATVAASGCLEDDDAMILREFEPGTYHIVVDSRSPMGGEFSLLVLDDGEVPTAATNLAGKVTAPGKVTIAWDAATGIDPIAKYAIWRGQETEWGRDFDELPFAIVDGSTLSCVDSGCIPGTTNYYRVMAVDAKGDAGPFSEGVGVAVP
jgi:hypothetical protein